MQFGAGFGVCLIKRNAIDGTNLDALGGLEVADTLRAQRRVDDVDFFTGGNRIIRTFRFADVTVDAFVSYFQRHTGLSSRT